MTCIIVPNDVAGAGRGRGAAARARHGPLGRRLLARRASCPSDDDLERAAEVLNAGEKVAMLVGQGALGAADEVIEVAELLGAGVAKALLGKAVLPDDLPFVTGSIGLLGTKPSWDLMTELRHAADGRLELPVLRVPARGGPGARRADRHRRRGCSASATRWRSTSSATARETLRALLPLLERKTDRVLARGDRGGRRATGGSCWRRAR